eukprot:TRINITY_DN6317_c0_g1_i1.p1 TRINITY_DN6317_c0_g1~~TRINITY_DN6317_c0_g1_i1.p1  ORF type:complete len:119 (-),score=12.19 TRINITY_DN6317_c0_g1_i1:52-408(-)
MGKRGNKSKAAAAPAVVPLSATLPDTPPPRMLRGGALLPAPATPCPAHTDPDLGPVSFHDDASRDSARTGQLTGYDYCRLCGLVTENWTDTDDPADPPLVGYYIDVEDPEHTPSGEHW